MIENKEDNQFMETETATVDFSESGSIVGQTLDGRFYIDRDLTKTGADAGGMGLVYLARDTKLLGREVVVKILQKTSLENSDLLRKFEHEQEALIRLDHPNIVRILDKGTLSDGNPFMVMEYIDGYSLRKKLKDNGKLSLALVAHITDAVSKALHAANQKKIFHRDVKPENIMLTPQDEGFERVRLIDFGIARVEESEVAPVTTVPRGTGTIRYIAPEQLAGNLDLTPASDIYSLGIMIYEMLTGSLPFNPRSIVEMFELQKVGVQTPPRDLRPDLSVEAEKILLSALQFHAENRPQSALAFGGDLVRAMNAVSKNSDDFIDDKTINMGLDSPTEPTLVRPVSTPRPIAKQILIAMLVGTLFAIPAGYLMWRNFGPGSGVTTNTQPETLPGNSQPETVTVQTREITYFLNVQKMRDGKVFETPFKSSGQDVYEDGYKFSLAFAANADGYMYAFNQGKDTAGKTQYYLLFPTPKNKDGRANVTAGQEVTTSQNTFGGGRGTEIVWLIWTKERSDVLDAVLGSALTNSGTLVDAGRSQDLQSFIEKFNSPDNMTKKDSSTQSTLITGKGDVIVNKLELEHR